MILPDPSMDAADDPAAMADALFLETPWVLYVHFQCASINYNASYCEIGRVTTVGEFWRLMNHVPDIRQLHHGRVSLEQTRIVAYSLFRDGIKPEWEDPCNIQGSEWGCRENLEVERFAQLWRDYILGAIGEHIPHCNGIRAINKSNRTRTLHKIEVWMDTSDHAKSQACRRALSVLVPQSPKFAHMFHCEKRNQAIEYHRRRRRAALNDDDALDGACTG